MHLYVHVPFCARRCSYCDFAIAVRRVVPSKDFEAAVLREWESLQEHPAWGSSAELDSIYFGGGTPSHLDPGSLATLLARFRGDRSLASDAEITLEANPDDVNASSAEVWRSAGFNRVSLGAQSFSDRALQWMHRTHDAEQIGRAVLALRAAGFRNLSLDLIYGLPESLERDWSADLDRALGLEPEHLSLYGLTIEPGTPLSRWTIRGELVPLPDDRAASEYLLAHDRLVRARYDHYEVSNAAKPGFRARHNSAYWARRPFLGIGPAAHSGFGAVRSWNVREWEEYRRNSVSGAAVVAESESLSGDQVSLEELYLGLRTTDGLPASRLPPEIRTAWIDQGWAQADSDWVRLTPEGWLRLDALVASLAGH